MPIGRNAATATVRALPHHIDRRVIGVVRGFCWHRQLEITADRLPGGGAVRYGGEPIGVQDRPRPWCSAQRGDVADGELTQGGAAAVGVRADDQSAQAHSAQAGAIQRRIVANRPPRGVRIKANQLRGGAARHGDVRLLIPAVFAIGDEPFNGHPAAVVAAAEGGFQTIQIEPVGIDPARHHL